MKKILIVANSVSMIDLFNRDNINILLDLGYKVYVGCNFEKGNITDNTRINQFKNTLKNKSIEYFNLPIPRNPMNFFSILKSYRILLKVAKLNFTAVHCHSPIASVLTRIVFDKYRKSLKTKVIYSAHGFHFFKGSSFLSWLIYYPIEKILSKKTDLILTINQEDFNLAKSKFKTKVDYVPGVGIDINRFNQKIIFNEKKLIIKTKDSIFIGSIGQISKRKNHLAIIKALNFLKNPQIHYFIAGFGELEPKILEYSKKNNLQDNIHVLGFINDIPGFLNQMDIFAFPSLQEGLPVSLMEAMASSKAIIASKIRGNIDLLGEDYQYYIEPLDYPNISKIINQVMIKLKENQFICFKNKDSV